MVRKEIVQGGPCLALIMTDRCPLVNVIPLSDTTTVSTMAQVRPRLITRILDTAHKATVIFLIGSSIFMLGAIGANIMTMRRTRLEKLAEHQALEAAREDELQGSTV